LDEERKPFAIREPLLQCAISGSARLAPLLSMHGRGAGSHDHPEYRPFFDNLALPPVLVEIAAARSV
jgi:hypothetical protein